MEDHTNPYASPIDTADSIGASDNLPDAKPTLGNAFLRWSIICVVAAAPSFFFGLMITNGTLGSVIAMLVGVGLFVVGFAFLDIHPFWRRWMSQKLTRKAIISAFGIRVVISIVFPVGAVNDMACGMLSTSGVGFFFPVGVFGTSSNSIGIIPTLLITLAQGVLLNVEIAIVAIVLYAIMVAFSNTKQRKRRELKALPEKVR